MKVYVIVYMEDDGGCSDPDCCGGSSSWPVVVKASFKTEKEARAHVKTLPRGYDYEVHEVTVQ